MSDHPNVRRFLDLSTAHLSAETRDNWGDGDRPAWVSETEYGFFVWAGSEDDPQTDDGLPVEVAAARARARALGCDYILFDADALFDDELKVFDDE